MPRIAKIKYKDGTVHILEKSGEGSLVESETQHKICAEPHPDFRNAMDELVKHVRDILGWPSTLYPSRIRITGVSYSMSEDTGVEGAVMSGLVELDASDSPFSFNTPHLPFEQYSETGVSKLMPEDAVESLNELRREARLFLEGKRSQGDLFAANDGKARAAGDATIQ